MQRSLQKAFFQDRKKCMIEGITWIWLMTQAVPPFTISWNASHFFSILGSWDDAWLQICMKHFICLSDKNICRILLSDIKCIGNIRFYGVYIGQRHPLIITENKQNSSLKERNYTTYHLMQLHQSRITEFYNLPRATYNTMGRRFIIYKSAQQKRQSYHTTE